MSDQEHTVEVAPTVAYFAECSCGWTSDEWPDEGEAQCRAEEHADECARKGEQR